jgi:hypothetical protein
VGPAPSDGAPESMIITRPVLELVLRHTSQGPTYGLAASNLKRKAIYKVVSDVVAEAQFDIEARVVSHFSDGDHLFVRTCYTMVSTKASPDVACVPGQC